MADSMGQNLSDIRDEQRKQTDAFKANMPAYEQTQYDQASDQAKTQLAGQMKGINRASSSRGLLYSGLNQSAQQGAQAQTAGGLAGTRAQINQSTQDQYNQMNTQAMNTALAVQQQQEQQAQLAYQQALFNYQQRSDMMSGIFGAAGSVVGGLLGSSSAGNTAGKGVGGAV